MLTLKRLRSLEDKYKTAEAALGSLSEEMLQTLGLKPETALKALVRLEEFDVHGYEQELEKRSIRLFSIDDPEYPAMLRNIPDAPVFLYVRGDLGVLSEPCIALVGSREMSDEGKRVIEHFVGPIVAAGCTTVSGLAYGVDGEVAKETLHVGGKTVAVLGSGLASVYPKAHERLADEIVARGGLVMSEFPLDTQPDKYTFPARNRIIAGLSLATIVIEAAEESGSLITAELALEYGREVCAVPGSIFDPGHAGCHQLIATGQAKLVSSAQDVLAEVGIVARESMQPTLFVAANPDEEAVAGALSSLPSALDDIVVKAKLEAATIGAVLTILELKGAARNVGGGKWVRA